MASTYLGPYRVSAYNTARDSDNKIHDGAFARSLGFGGGMVPGVAVYGYMTHLAVTRWGRLWLERGTAECRFYKPVYDGDIATVTAQADDGGLDISVESRGEACATGRASLPDSLPAAPSLDQFPHVPQHRERPPADEASLAVGTWLGLDPYPIVPAESERYLADLREASPLYARDRLIHPAMILQSCNLVLNRNVVLGPWIHTGSRIQHLATAAVGDRLSVRARITGNYEHKGHRFVELDALIITGEASPVAHVAHTAIYRPRQVAAAA
jgi:acyl dehydratase